MHVPKEALALIGAASKDPTRYALNGIRLEANGTQHATATDGHVLVRLTWNEDSDTRESFTLGRELATAAKKALTSRESHFEAYEDEDLAIVVETEDDVLTDSENLGSFPDADQFLSRARKGQATTLLVNPFKLLDALQTVIKSVAMTRTSGAPLVNLTFSKKSEPILLKGKSSEGYLEVTALVMPLTK